MVRAKDERRSPRPLGGRHDLARPSWWGDDREDHEVVVGGLDEGIGQGRPALDHVVQANFGSEPKGPGQHRAAQVAIDQEGATGPTGQGPGERENQGRPPFGAVGAGEEQELRASLVASRDHGVGQGFEAVAVRSLQGSDRLRPGQDRGRGGLGLGRLNREVRPGRAGARGRSISPCQGEVNVPHATPPRENRRGQGSRLGPRPGDRPRGPTRALSAERSAQWSGRSLRSGRRWLGARPQVGDAGGSGRTPIHSRVCRGWFRSWGTRAAPMTSAKRTKGPRPQPEPRASSGDGPGRRPGGPLGTGAGSGLGSGP